MSIQVFGLPVSRGVAIGRAVLVASSRVDVAHYYIDASRVEAEVDRLRQARDFVAHELTTLKRELPAEAPAELPALLDVHLMLLHDDAMAAATRHWIEVRHYNAEWALSAQLEVVARQFDEYFSRRRRAFDVPVDLRLSRGFRSSVLAHLRQIPYGATESYAQVAAATGHPRAVRAAGTACATNPVPIVVPCHRVVRSDGSPGGYAGGPDAKRSLLTLEAA